MGLNRRLARILDAIMLVGLTVYIIAVVLLMREAVAITTETLLVWCVAVWIGPGLARTLIVPRGAGEPSTNRFLAYSNARDGGRPPWWVMVARVLLPLLPVLVGAVSYFRHDMLLAGLALTLITLGVLYGAFFRATVELTALLATALVPHRAATIRSRAERAWNLIYFVGLPLYFVSTFRL